jgi:uncharacterized membrane protein
MVRTHRGLAVGKGFGDGLRIREIAMKERAQTTRIEPRWLVALVVLAVFALLTVLPGRVRAFPVWVSCVLVILLMVPMAAVTLAANKTMWLGVERIATLLFILIAGFALLDNLQRLLGQMVRHSSGLGGFSLLTSSLAIWATNVLIFALAYWRLDRGGPEARANHATTKPDWYFPQEQSPEQAPSGWGPTFIDYLFLAFCTATAFSPTEAMPMTARAKSLMMLESVLSLVTVIAVIARAINTLGG